MKNAIVGMIQVYHWERTRPRVQMSAARREQNGSQETIYTGRNCRRRRVRSEYFPLYTSRDL